MSFKDPASFAQIKLFAESMIKSVETLEKHSEGRKAFAVWVNDVDFRERYGTRYKDLPHTAELLVLSQDSFGIDEKGVLFVESYYSTCLWVDGEWVDADEVDED